MTLSELPVARSWWSIALRGVAAIIFAILAIVWPGLTILALVLIFGAYALVDGVLAIFAGFRAEQSGTRWFLIIEGIVSVLAGLVALVVPEAAALAFVLLIAAWAIVTGVLEIIAAIRLRQEIENEWGYIALGAVSVLFGVLLALFPVTGAISLVFVIAAYALLFGILLLVVAFRLRSVQHGQQQQISGAIS